MDNFELIYETSSNDKVYLNSDFLLVDLPYEKNGIANSYLNGGYKTNFKSLFNMHLSTELINRIDMNTIDEFLAETAESISLDPDKSTCLLTHAETRNSSIVTREFKKVSVTAITTAGTRVNAVRAGDDASYYEENHNYYSLKNNEKIGTINIILLINSKLNENSLINGIVTATEAKAAVLEELMIPSQYSDGIATGTGTDGIIIISDSKSDNVLENTGKHSKLGELIACAVKDSVRNALVKQMSLSSTTQSSVLTRLYRFKLDINDFYRDFTEAEKEEFIRNLVRVNHKQKYVAITTTVLHLIDQVRYNLITRSSAYDLALSIVDNSFSENDSKEVQSLLYYWIDYYLS